MRTNHQFGHFDGIQIDSQINYGTMKRVLSGNITLSLGMGPLLFLEASSADRNVTMPSVTATDSQRPGAPGSMWYITNIGASNNIVVKEPVGPTTIGVITPGQTAMVFTHGVTWYAQQLLAGGTAGGGVLGVAAGYKLARGSTALDGSNPTPVTTGLTSIAAATVSLRGTSSPGVGTSVLTTGVSSGTLNVYAWKVTGSGDTTLIASTGTETFDWIAIGA